MASESWEEFTTQLGSAFPISPQADGVPELTRGLDEGVERLITGTLLADDKRLNPLYIENLLSDCIARINNCISLREKAQEIEVRAIADALSYKAQKASSDFQKFYRAQLGDIHRSLLQNAIGAVVKGERVSTVTFSDEIWAAIEEAEKRVVAEQDSNLTMRVEKARQPSNGANHAERFSAIKTLFDLAIVEAYRRCRVAATGLAKIYGLTEPKLPDPAPTGYLDSLALWAQQMSNQLDAELDGRVMATTMFVLGADGNKEANDTWLLTRAEYDKQIDARSLAFGLEDSHFAALGMSDVKLRSVKVQARLASDDLKTHLWRAQLTLPPNPVTGATDAYPLLLATTFQDFSDTEAVVKGVHNVSPVGKWRVEIDETSPTGDLVASSTIKNVWLLMRVSYRSA